MPRVKDKCPPGYERIRTFIGGGVGKEVKCNRCGYITSTLQFEPRCSNCHRAWIEIDGEFFMIKQASHG